MNYKEKQTHMYESPEHYDRIPNYCIENATSILDVGCMSGINAILSRHREHFVRVESNNQFLGVDILEYPKNYLSPIIIKNFLDFHTQKHFDLVIALHFIEHIPFEYWPKIFEKLKYLVSHNGYLIIATPHNEKSYDGCHFTFNIKETTFSDFLENITVKIKRATYRNFREPNESLLWATIRAIYRIITRHEYRYRLWSNKEIMVIWKNGVEE